MDDAASESVGKVCIVCTGSEGNNDTDEYLVFIVDLKVPSGGKSVVEIGMFPTVRIDADSLYMPAICVLGNTLYMFEGHRHPRGKSMLTYELPEDFSNLKLDRSMLAHGPPMLGFKERPKATPTPSGEILVFSSLIDTTERNECDFELFNPVSGQWRKLPSLYPWVEPWVDRSPQGLGFGLCWIKSFTFMYHDTLFLHTDVRGGLTLKITGSGDETWKTPAFEGDEYFPIHMGDTVVLLGRKVCMMMPGIAYDLRPFPHVKNLPHVKNPFHSLFYTFPERSSLHYNATYFAVGGGIVLLENSTPDCIDYNVCMLEVGVKEEAQAQQPELLLQVYNGNFKEECDKVLSKLRKKKASEYTNSRQGQDVNWSQGQYLPGTKKVMTLKILGGTGPTNTLSLRSFSSIPVCAYHP